VNLGNTFGSLANMNIIDTGFSQVLDVARILLIGTANGVASLISNLRQGTNACAANARKIDVHERYYA
jgi:hypothetical protein